MRKLGGSLQYEDLGPGVPRAATSYTVGGRSVHAYDASSGLSPGTITATRQRRVTGHRSAPFTIKRKLPAPIEG